MEKSEQGTYLNDLKAVSNCGVSVCQISAITLEVFLHGGFGARYLGLQAALAVPLVMVFSMFFSPGSAAALFKFLIAYIVMCIFARIGILYRSWVGKEAAHSRYTGKPHIAILLPMLSEVNVKRLEVLVAFGCGYVIYQQTAALGAYLMTAAVGLFFSLLFSDWYGQTRALDMRDAVADQTEVAARFKKLQGR